MPVKKIYLVRHGRIPANAAHRVPLKDEALDDLGQHQANALADRLANVDIDHVYTSDYLRTQQTVAPLIAQKKLPTSVEPCFGEFFEGSALVGKSEEDPEVLAARDGHNSRQDTDPSWSYGDSDSFTSFAERIVHGKELLESAPYENILVASHAFYLRGFISAVLNNSFTPSSAWFQSISRLSITNTGITLFTVEDKDWKAITINDYAHFAE